MNIVNYRINKILYLLLVFFTGVSPIISQQYVDKINAQLDITPKDDQVHYTPSEGDTVHMNPPPFVWLPVKKDIMYPPDYVEYNGDDKQIWVPVKAEYTYTLQISRDQNFSVGTISREGIDISTYALDKSLAPGEWFWRYGVESENGETIYSKSRRFYMPESVKSRPFPDIEEVIASIPKGHPRLFILKDDLEKYRKRALYGDLKETVEEIKQEIRNSIGEQQPEEPKYVKGIGPEFGEHSWRLIYDAVIPPCDLMEKFGLVYLLTGDEKYGEEAKRRVLHFSRWDPDGSTSDRGHDEPAMRILSKGSRAYDWTYDLFTPGERELVNHSMIRRSTQFYERLKYRPGKEYHVYNRDSHAEEINWFLGEAALVYNDITHEAADWLKYTLTVQRNLWPAWAKDDGGWHQGPAYWSSYMRRVLEFVMVMRKAADIDLMQDNRFYHNTPYYILYSNPPYARMSPFGDSEDKPPSKSRAEVMYSFSSLLHDPYLRWYADYMDATHANNILGLLLKNEELLSKAPVDLPASRYFPGVGLVSLHTNLGNRSEDVHFLYHSDPYGGVSHGHPDQNAFTIEAYGESLAIASGYYPWFGSDHHRNWSRQTKSSNSITIDGGQGQQIVAAAKGKVVRFENRDIYDYILGDATKAYMGLLDKFYRHVIHIRPGIFVLFDELEAPEPAEFEWWLHAISEMSVDEMGKTVIISEGDSNLKVNFLQSEKIKFDQFSGFPFPPERRGKDSNDNYKDQWHLTASTVSKSNKANFITVLVPYKKNHEPNITISQLVEKEDIVSFELGINDHKYIVNLKPEVQVKLINPKD